MVSCLMGDSTALASAIVRCCPNNHLSSIENGRVSPSFDLFVQICKELEVTPDYLLLGVMYSKNIPKSIEDGLRLCTKEDLDLINEIVQFCVKRGCK